MDAEFNPPASFSKSPTFGTLAGALAKAQAEMKNPGFDRVNPHFKNRYATLGAHLDAIRAPLTKNGIAVIQTVSTPSPDYVTVSTIIAHSSGEWLSCEASARAGNNIQAMGSSVTYLRRYCLASVLGIVGDEDTDGEEDRKSHQEPRREAPAAPSGGEPTFTTAEAKGLMKALAAKQIPFGDLIEAMKRAGLSADAEITTWPMSWKPRIQSWLKGQTSRAPSAEAVVDEQA